MPFALASAADLGDIVTLRNAAVAARPLAFGTDVWTQGDAAAFLAQKRVVTYRDSTNALRGFIVVERKGGFWRDGQQVDAWLLHYVCIDPTLTLALTLRTIMDGIKQWASTHDSVVLLLGFVPEDSPAFQYFGPAGQNYDEVYRFTQDDGVVMHLYARAVTGTVG